VLAQGWRDAPVERHGHLHQDQGTLVLDPAREAFVDAAGFGLADADCDFNAGGAHAVRAVSGDVGVGIDRGRDDALEAGGDEGFCTGTGAAGVIARFEGDIGGAAAKAFPGVLLCDPEGDDFGVIEQVVLMPALTGHLPGAIENHAAHGGIGGRNGDAAAGKFEGALHPVGVLVGRGHGAERGDEVTTISLSEFWSCVPGRGFHGSNSSLRAEVPRLMVRNSYGSTRGIPAESCRSIIMTSLRSSWMKSAVFLPETIFRKMEIYFSLSCATD